MKVINDDGDVLFEGSDDTSLLIFEEPNAVPHMIVRSGEGDEQVQPQALQCAMVGIYLTDPRNIEDIQRFFDMKSAEVH